MTTATTTRAKKCTHEVAEDLSAALESVDLSAVPVMTTDRHIPRKDQAKLARELFKRLGLKGISVTTPNYSMAQSVEVSVPRLGIHVENMWPHGGANYHASGADVHDSQKCPACVKNRENEKQVEKIIGIAFPNHDDRSESQSDYFDYCWSIHHHD